MSDYANLIERALENITEDRRDLAAGHNGRSHLSQAETSALAAAVEALTAERDALYECDCVTDVVSSQSCPKCGRRGVISYERWLEIAVAANRAEAAEAARDQAIAERDAALKGQEFHDRAEMGWADAVADRDRLAAALHGIEKIAYGWSEEAAHGDFERIWKIAREALAATEAS